MPGSRVEFQQLFKVDGDGRRGGGGSVSGVLVGVEEASEGRALHNKIRPPSALQRSHWNVD